jgi:hypothetical protein
VSDAAEYDEALGDRIARQFRSSGLKDPRAESPWMRGWLGDPKAEAWFISEAPSQWRIDRETPKAPRTPEDQWALSPGDREFRKALTIGGFKEGQPLGHGGWRSYITVLSKSFVDFSSWRKRPFEEKLALFRQWAPVLDWELRNGAPRVVVAMGEVTEKALTRLRDEGLLHFPGEPLRIWSYGYLMQPTRDGAPAMDPVRVRKYQEQIAGIRHAVETIARQP